MMLITAEALAPQLGISVDQIYRLARTKQIPSHRLGRAVRFNLEEVLAATVTTPPIRPLSIARAMASQAWVRRPKTTARIDWRTA